jgi:hypothetical protein
MPFPSKPHPSVIDGSTLPYMGHGWGLEDVKKYFGVFSVYISFLRTPYYAPIPYKTRGKAVYGCCKAVSRLFSKETDGFSLILTSVHDRKPTRTLFSHF